MPDAIGNKMTDGDHSVGRSARGNYRGSQDMAVVEALRDRGLLHVVRVDIETVKGEHAPPPGWEGDMARVRREVDNLSVAKPLPQSAAWKTGDRGEVWVAALQFVSWQGTR